MSNGVIKDSRHNVTDFAPGAWGEPKVVQPHFHIHSADILQICRPPFGDDMICKVMRIGLDSSVGLFLSSQLVLAVVGYELSYRLRYFELQVDVFAKRIGHFFCVPAMREPNHRSNGSLSIRACAVGLLVPTKLLRVWTGLALHFQETSLL